ncbi:fimbria/pilus outer membrane usher protein [Halomonas huangheensis]|uniref:PapC-like C-terminal domain-containing protein n=1 Tax=Halomonas huangheensis TaxID=1178482 RepID=W1N317_9GAMM|nr:fimbria/pilus outer membrane usher protein [Halomonas huangheensis]ALM52399.1 hypothetical protein AR456_08990 [Halomonas huangheensis]ERL49345.1 hypothetical protein BJB45_07695 [Halomonas huangheensis]
MPVITGSVAFLEKNIDLFRNTITSHLRIKTLRNLLILIAVTLLQLAIAPESSAVEEPAFEFDSRFLRGNGSNVNVSHFEHSNLLTEGRYQLSVWLNEKEPFDQEVNVVNGPDEEPVLCFSETAVQQWGVRFGALPDQALLEQQREQQCLQVEVLIPNAKAAVDVAALRVDVSIPQLYLGQVRRGYISPTDWDNGITAGFLGYTANAFNSRPDTGDSSTRYSANLAAGFNIGAWRLRHNANVQGGDETGYESINTYAQRDVVPLKAQFTAGEYFTPGDQFDSVPFRGVQLTSDDQMLPESERGFAPVVRGIANSNAVVTVRQSDTVIYETSVPPGEFVINDLYATSYAGDLEVTVTEADGSERRFTVPFSSVVQLLRPGASRFSATLGQYRDTETGSGPMFGQATYRRGINNIITMYGGATLAEQYGSAVVGAAVSTPVGALSTDATLSRVQDVLMTSGERETLSGESYRISYSKQLDASKTNLSLAAYRFSSDEYLDFADYAQLESRNDSFDSIRREQHRFQVSISQPLGSYGNLGVSGISRSWWDERDDTTTFQVNYSRAFNWGSLSLSANRDLSNNEPDDGNGADTRYLATVSFPIGHGARSPRLSLSSSFEDSDNYQMRTSMTGVVGERDQGSYQLYATHTANVGASAREYGGSLQWNTPVAALGTSASVGDTSSQYSASISGTVLAHSGGLVFSPERGETMALIKAEGAEGASLRSSRGPVVNDQGYALAATLTPYRYNRLNLDTSTLDASIELSATGQDVVPTRGAIVAVEYPTDNGMPLLIRVTNNQQIPFASSVIDPLSGEMLTMVGQGGVIYVRGDYDVLDVDLGQGTSCQIQLPNIEALPVDERGYRSIELPCSGAGQLHSIAGS